MKEVSCGIETEGERKGVAPGRGSDGTILPRVEPIRKGFLPKADSGAVNRDKSRLYASLNREIVAILQQQTVAQIVREHGLSEATFYAWKSKYAGASVAELTRLWAPGRRA